MELALVNDSVCFTKSYFHEDLFCTPVLLSPEPVITTSVAPDNAWVGATLAYNIQDEASIDNVIGSTRIVIAPVEKFINKKFNLAVIGNIGRIATLDRDSAVGSLMSLAQSSQGLSIGIAPMYRLSLNKGTEIQEANEILKFYLTANYRANKYKVGMEDSLVERTLNQARFTLGCELEGFKVKNGRTFTIGEEGFLSYHDGRTFESVFGQYKDATFGVEATLIVPLGGVFGFLINGTYIHGDTPIYQTGLIVGIEGSTRRDEE
ncbi:MAG: hypothetical protein H6595_10025 [Flavobacteriales bacterium]|nr:hypothetical protein [Flavobacteriales bacterium]